MLKRLYNLNAVVDVVLSSIQPPGTKGPKSPTSYYIGRGLYRQDVLFSNLNLSRGVGSPDSEFGGARESLSKTGTYCSIFDEQLSFYREDHRDK